MQKKLKLLNGVMKSRNSGKLYLFGAGKIGKELLEHLLQYHVAVQAFIDNNRTLETINGVRVISPDEFMASATKDDFILITCAAYEEIDKQLQALGWRNYLHSCEIPDIKEYALDYDIVQAGGRTCWEKAVSWLLHYKIPNGGISYSNKRLKAYPEVTGYLIPTLVEYGYYEEAKDCVKWLLSIQEDDGGYADINHTKEFVFDTAQILRGMLCFYDHEEIGSKVVESIEKICQYLHANMIDDGRGGYIKQYEHDQTIPEAILLYTLPPFKKAAELLNREDYLAAIENCAAFYENQTDFLRTTDLTHFLAYEIEALIDLGRGARAEEVLHELFASQMEDGAIPSHKNSQWVCTPGAAQLALCELKMGEVTHAERILGWLRSVQMPTGGFGGSYGPGAAYFQGVEIAWAVKYYLDAERLYIEKWFDFNTDGFPDTIAKADARYQIVAKEIEKINGGVNARIAEIGCGKGRFLKRILEDGFQGGIDGIDISEELLKFLPDGVKKIHGRMENIPCEDSQYDFVFCVEALEHSQNMQLAVSEMVRILNPGGRLLIIDKDKAYWGLMKCSVWENWIGKEDLQTIMGNYLSDAAVGQVDEKHPYMLFWTGKKVK